ncbi:MAG: AmmeMemoRadiSam system protein B [Anaerolineae bacterium]|nr:AmmeMemoRadiSam system protein B [Thermoflexales bacterium]MDW8406268.1 AmmeMemoRadiSam system protein B [Anaerolineae bacterium]
MHDAAHQQHASVRHAAYIRPAALAGSWYPANPTDLANTVDHLLAAVEPVDGAPTALIVPHAGYAYSGKIAAAGWRQVEQGCYDTVVILAPAHRVRPHKPLAVWESGAFATPLGEVPVDVDVCRALVEASPYIAVDHASHLPEHAIEIQLPFLQRVCPSCRLVPIVMGEGAEEDRVVQQVAEALARVLTGRRALIVASSDLSHYPSYRSALAIDQATLGAIEAGDPVLLRTTLDEAMHSGASNLLTCACGEAPILVVMCAAALLGAETITVLDYANSGDAPRGDHRQVVGYGAVMFWHYEPPALSQAQQQCLLRLAYDAITAYLRTGSVPEAQIDDPTLTRRAGAFVTLWQGEELRGCIGHIKADLPLYRVVQQMAVSAATSDTRFDPLSVDELNGLTVEISVLSPLRRITRIEQVEVGKHGLLVAKQGRRGLLLPEVAAERGWDRYEFAEAVCWKAGLPAGCWREGGALYTFTALVFKGQPVV